MESETHKRSLREEKKGEMIYSIDIGSSQNLNNFKKRITNECSYLLSYTNLRHRSPFTVFPTIRIMR